jgi:hypothetical protein
MDFYKTKVIIEVEVSHQFDPEDGIRIVTGRLTGADIPAITSVKVIEAKSNYVLHNKPLEEMIAVKRISG